LTVLIETIGSYNQNQQIDILSKENMFFDILSCIENISLKNGKPFMTVHIILLGQNEHISGSQLFPKTFVFKGKIELK